MSIVFLILPLLKKIKTEIFLYPQNCYNGVLDFFNASHIMHIGWGQRKVAY